jgi:hypothetical protein
VEVVDGIQKIGTGQILILQMPKYIRSVDLSVGNGGDGRSVVDDHYEIVEVYAAAKVASHKLVEVGLADGVDSSGKFAKTLNSHTNTPLGVYTP